jgi:hypothetical protein
LPSGEKTTQLMYLSPLNWQVEGFAGPGAAFFSSAAFGAGFAGAATGFTGAEAAFFSSAAFGAGLPGAVAGFAGAGATSSSSFFGGVAFFSSLTTSCFWQASPHTSVSSLIKQVN